MKKLILASMFALIGAFSINAQRIAVVDVTDVLQSLPAYAEAQSQLDQTAAQWRQEIAQEYDKIKSMYNKYQAEQVLLSEDARVQREEEIMEKERIVREMQKEKFGPSGSLFQRRQELVQPIQDKVYGAIEGFAGDRGYDFIFDKGGSAGLLFSTDEYDKTDDIKKRLASN